jgi:RNA-directed DNA polymerase
MELMEMILSRENLNRAYKKVIANKGASGIDGVTVNELGDYIRENREQIVSSLRSRTYFPKPVRRVYTPKSDGRQRPLGIPTVEDRIAQMVAKMYFEPCVEPIFYSDSYGYRPNKSAIQALEVTRERCWRKDWVFEFDIKGLFDNIRHDYLIEMVKRHTEKTWVIMYIKRWLVAPFQMEDGTIVTRTSGTPQGGVISPVLSNLFLHYVYDDFVTKEFPTIPWARYADDGIAHCVSLKQAKYLQRRLEERFLVFGLELNLDKTKIVYCKDEDRKGNHEHTSFDFLGYTFRPRHAKNKYGKFFTNFLPAIGEKVKKSIRKEVRSWKLQLKPDKDILWDIANMFNRKIQGWINYYTHFYKSEVYGTLRYIVSAGTPTVVQEKPTVDILK